MKTAIGQDKLGIGYVGIGHVDKSVAALTFDKMVPSQGKRASGACHPDPPAVHEHQGCALRPDQGLHRLYLLA